MCKECGCDTNTNNPQKTFTIDKNVTEVNNILAEQNNIILKEKKILCINLMGSPGSGKTTFIESLTSHIPSDDIAVIQGDLESDIDKVRLEKSGIHTYQINTHSGCHLNASMINKALSDICLTDKKYLFIENVGNLVCPAGILIGQHINIVISSTTEGSDKPKKYPYIFAEADLVIISKTDIADAVSFLEEQYKRDLLSIKPGLTIYKTSSKQPESYAQAGHFISHKRDHLLSISHSHT
jgi:hydrogenase nickel incorporation protein HypB